VEIVAEIKGDWSLDVPGGFRLTGRADRIERRADGSLAILDYKTGTPPTPADVKAGHVPQLLLEAAMARAGAFGEALRGEVVELTYWHLSGGYTCGNTFTPFEDDPEALRAAVDTAEARLRALIAAFDDPARPYLCAPHPARATRASAYAHLARRAEWDRGESA
jgi:ATP-dependent helicase/nuclease subunit B